MADLLTTLHPINDNNTDLYPNVKNENIPPVISGKDAMEALDGDFSTLHTDEVQVGGENGTLINKDQIVTQNKVINLDEIVDDAELAQGLNGKVDKVQGKGLSTNDFTNADKALVDSIPDKVDKVAGKGLSTNDFTDADKALVDTIPDKVNKEQGKGLSTNDFTNEYKKDLDQDIPDQIQLFKDAFEETAIAINGKVDKVSGKGLSTNDYTNADKLLVDSIPDKVDKVQGKGLSTNDFTNADKAYLDNLPTYFISIASGGVVNLAEAPSTPTTNYFGAKNGTSSFFLLNDREIKGRVTGNNGDTWNFSMNGNTNSVPMFTHITPASGDNPAQIRQYKLPNDIDAGVYHFLVSTDSHFSHTVSEDVSNCEFYQTPTAIGIALQNVADDVYMSAEIVNNAGGDSDLQDDYAIPLFLNLGVEIENNPDVISATVKATAINSGDSYFSYMILDFRIELTSNNVNSVDLKVTFNKDILKYYIDENDTEIHTRTGWVYCDAINDNHMTLEWVRDNGSMGTGISGTLIINVGER